MIEATIPSTGGAGEPTVRRGLYPPFPRRIRRVNRNGMGATVSFSVSDARFACYIREMIRTLVLTIFVALVAGLTVSLAPPAHAQIGNIFSDQPRPPGSVPRGGQQQQQAIPDDEEEVPELPRGRLLPAPNRPLPG